MGIATTLVSAGLISISASNLITALFGLIPGALAASGTILAARHVAKSAGPLVTPVSDPQNNQGRRLVPEMPMPVQPVITTTTNFPPSTTTGTSGSAVFGPLGT
jgi:hypothetical protein